MENQSKEASSHSSPHANIDNHTNISMNSQEDKQANNHSMSSSYTEEIASRRIFLVKKEEWRGRLLVLFMRTLNLLFRSFFRPLFSNLFLYLLRPSFDYVFHPFYSYFIKPFFNYIIKPFFKYTFNYMIKPSYRYMMKPAYERALLPFYSHLLSSSSSFFHSFLRPISLHVIKSINWLMKEYLITPYYHYIIKPFFTDIAFPLYRGVSSLYRSISILSSHLLSSSFSFLSSHLLSPSFSFLSRTTSHLYSHFLFPLFTSTSSMISPSMRVISINIISPSMRYIISPSMRYIISPSMRVISTYIISPSMRLPPMRWMKKGWEMIKGMGEWIMEGDFL